MEKLISDAFQQIISFYDANDGMPLAGDIETEVTAIFETVANSKIKELNTRAEAAEAQLKELQEVSKMYDAAKSAIAWLCDNLYQLDFNCKNPTIGLSVPDDYWFVGEFSRPEDIENALECLVNAVEKIREEEREV